jgi:Domain of unknown function (DUF4136)
MPRMHQWNGGRLVAAAALVSLTFLVGCDEHVQITRDHDVRIPRHATWAWRPAVAEARNTPPPSAPTGDNRPVISRDTLNPTPPPQGRAGAPPREPSAEDEVVRQRVKTAIEQTLASKGFQQVDPAQAEFLVDYKFATRRFNETVPAYGGYPGLVCGPFGCWYGGYGPGWAGYENVHFREGTIVFDWLQRDTKHLAYRAVGEKSVHRDAFSLSQDDINSLTHKLLSDLKPGK